MDFFQAQENARKKTGRLIFFYVAAVIAIIVTIYVILTLLFVQVGGRRGGDDTSNGNYSAYSNYSSNSGYSNNSSNSGGSPTFADYWQPELFAGTAAITIVIIGLGSLFKTMSLHSGGGVVARSVGGELVPPNTSDPQRRRLLNVVEEMSIAAGIRMPEVYVLPEHGINAFAAGYSPDDAAVTVSQGALDQLTRDELQGVIGHEFSHILNGDMRLNIKLIGMLFGILLLTIVGRVVVRAGFFSGGRRSSRDNKGGGAAIAILGLALIIIGYIGVLFGRLIQAAVSRQREFLADASSVQFTRNPDGITGALKKIGLSECGSRIDNAHATETSHMFFANALRSGFSGLFATHPPLVDRIKAIDATFDGDFRSARKSPQTYVPQPSPSQTQAPSRAAVPPLPRAVTSSVFLAALGSVGMPNAQHGASILDAIPDSLRDTARDPERARAVLLALLYQSQNAQAAAKQDAIIARTLTTTERTVLIECVRQIDTMPTWTRISLGDIALSSIRHLEDPQIDALLDAVDGFIAADGNVSLYEYAMRKVIMRNLRPPGRPGVLTKSCDALAAEISIVLSVLASAGASADAAVQHAFGAGVNIVRESPVSSPGIPITFVKPAEIKSDILDKALDALDESTPAVKQTVLAALVRTAADDGHVEPAEQELLRAIAAALNCPAPVLTAA